MTNDNKAASRYRLLKDLPNVKAGSEFRWCNLTGGYRYSHPNHFSVPRNYEEDMRNTFNKDCVENNPDWFKPVVLEKSEPIQLEITAVITEVIDIQKRDWPLLAVPFYIDHKGNVVYRWEHAGMVDCLIRTAAKYFIVTKISEH